MNEAVSISRDKLLSDLKTVVADSEELLRATAGALDEKAAAARARVQESVRTMKLKIQEVDDEVLGQMKDAARAADGYVHDHPWGAVGIAAAAGLLVGVLLARR